MKNLLLALLISLGGSVVISVLFAAVGAPWESGESRPTTTQVLHSLNEAPRMLDLHDGTRCAWSGGTPAMYPPYPGAEPQQLTYKCTDQQWLIGLPDDSTDIWWVRKQAFDTGQGAVGTRPIGESRRIAVLKSY